VLASRNRIGQGDHALNPALVIPGLRLNQGSHE
jgi:hypothetical protein